MGYEAEFLDAARTGGDLLGYLLVWIYFKLKDHDKRLADAGL